MLSSRGAWDDAKSRSIDFLNRIAGWLLLLGVIWLCWGCARLLWLFLAPPVVPNLPIAERQNRPVSQVNANTALTVFTVNKPPEAPQSPPPNVTLAGVMLASPSRLSAAMLDVNGTIANYRVGETLDGFEYTLLEVSWDQVIIADAQDNQMVLDMPERMALNQDKLQKNAEKPLNSRGITNRRLPNNSALNDPASLSTGLADNTKQNEAGNNLNNASSDETTSSSQPKDAIDTAVNELKENPASYLSQMGVMATGEGYQVTDAMPSHLKNRLGLESGDQVMSVNGQTVGSNPAGDADLLNQIKQSGEAVIEVKRGDQVITIRQQF